MVYVRLFLNAEAGAVADNAHHVIEVGQFLYFLLVLVDQGDVVAFLDQLGDQGLSDLAAADDDDLQSLFDRFLLLEHFFSIPKHPHLPSILYCI